MNNQQDSAKQPQNAVQRPLTGYHVAAMMVSFFAVIIAVNLTLAWFANSSWTGLVVKNSYVASQQFNEKIETARAQKALGRKLTFEYSNSLLSFSLKDAQGQPITNEKLIATVGRPVSETDDVKVSLSYIGQGRYQAKIDLPKGAWGFALDSQNQQKYHIEGRFNVNKDGRGVMEKEDSR